MKKVSLIIPCFNEHKNLLLLIDRFEELDFNNKEIEVIIVNNGSTDETDFFLKQIAPKYSYLTYTTVKNNK